MGPPSLILFSLGPLKPRIGSSAALWHLCKAYRVSGDATLSLIRSKSYSGFAFVPCIFLYFRSIELGLKVVLVTHGVPEQDVTRTLGHRISALLVRAETLCPLNEIGISAEDRDFLDRYSDIYSDKWLEYPDDFAMEYPTLEKLSDLARRVCGAARVYDIPKA